MFLGAALLHCVSAWGWLLAKRGAKSGVLVFAYWLNLGVFTLCAVGTGVLSLWLVLRFSSRRRASLGVGLCVQPPVHFQELWRKCAGTFLVPALCRNKAVLPSACAEAVWPPFSAGSGEQQLWFKPFWAGVMGPGLSPPGSPRWWGLTKKSRSLLCFIIP